MKSFRSTALALCCALPLLAFAQYQWIDKDGRKVFSDRAPPADIPAAKILRTPKGPALAAAEAAAPAASAPASAARVAGSAPRLSGKDKALEDRKKAAEAAEAAKRKEEEQKVAESQAENCQRARQTKAMYESGQRVTRTKENGEREFLDDKQRAEEVARMDQVIARDCKAQ